MALIEREALKRRIENYRMDCEVAGDTVAARVFADCITELEDAPTIDPIRAAGGCYCRECRFRGNPEECPILYFNQRELDEHDTSDTDFCSYGEPREAQDDG